MKTNFEEKKVKKYKLDDGIVFYLIDDLTEGSPIHAFIVTDPEYGIVPHYIWEENMKNIIADSTQIKRSNIVVSTSSPLAKSGTLVKGARLFELIACQKCGASTPKDAVYCTQCGDLIP